MRFAGANTRERESNLLKERRFSFAQIGFEDFNFDDELNNFHSSQSWMKDLGFFSTLTPVSE
jgi:hypothetical protein